METLIHLDGVTQGFHDRRGGDARACRASTWTSRRASTSRSPDPRAAANRRCWRFSACSIPSSDGTYVLNGQPVQGLKLSERARIRNREIGFIFQAFNLIGDLTVYENVELPLTYRGMPSAERKKRVHEALERVGMGHRVKHYPSQLSGGQQQRVAVARALAGDPVDPARGRADRQPRFDQRRSRHGSAPRTASRRRHHLHGDPRSALRALRRPHHSPVRRPHRRREGRGRDKLAIW